MSIIYLCIGSEKRKILCLYETVTTVAHALVKVNFTQESFNFKEYHLGRNSSKCDLNWTFRWILLKAEYPFPIWDGTTLCRLPEVSQAMYLFFIYIVHSHPNSSSYPILPISMACLLCFPYHLCLFSWSLVHSLLGSDCSAHPWLILIPIKLSSWRH